MKYEVEFSSEFKKSYKKCEKRGCDMKRIDKLIVTMANEGCAPTDTSPHKLSGSYAGFWECHISANLLLVWSQDDENLKMRFYSIGSHSDIF